MIWDEEPHVRTLCGGRREHDGKGCAKNFEKLLQFLRLAHIISKIAVSRVTIFLTGYWSMAVCLEVVRVRLKKETQSTLERIIGKSIDELSHMDAQEEIRFVESKTKKPLVFSKIVDSRMRGRGSPYIIRRRFCTMADVDKKILELK